MDVYDGNERMSRMNDNNYFRRVAMMKRLAVGAALLAFFAFPCFDRELSYAAPDLPSAHVHQVHDGDTITLRLKGKKYRARLIGIDAPEIGQRPWGRRAKEHLIQIMRRTDWTVYVETDVERIDKYGRLLIYIWTKKHAFINEKMISDGYAVTFTTAPNIRYADRFANAEKRARQKNKGIWGPEGSQESPLEWRKMHPRKN